jgi:hypothetical protein
MITSRSKLKLKSNGDDTTSEMSYVTLRNVATNEMFWGEGLNKIGTEIFIDDFNCAHQFVTTHKSADTVREICCYRVRLHIVSILGRCVNVL